MQQLIGLGQGVLSWLTSEDDAKITADGHRAWQDTSVVHCYSLISQGPAIWRLMLYIQTPWCKELVSDSLELMGM